MAGTFKVIELVGTSPSSFADAVRAAVEEAAKTVRNMSWFEVIQERGRIAEGKVAEFQVTIKVGSRRWNDIGIVTSIFDVALTFRLARADLGPIALQRMPGSSHALRRRFANYPIKGESHDLLRATR